MWLVRLALRRPYTFMVMALLIAILGGVAIASMPTDIFPDIDIPVVSVIWHYTGLPPEEMANRIATVYERALTTTVNDIEHIESQSYHRRRASSRSSSSRAPRSRWPIAQVTAISQTHAAADAARASRRRSSSTTTRRACPSCSSPHQQDAARAAAVRLRAELHPHAAGHRAGRADAAALRRQAARRSWSTSTPTPLLRQAACRRRRRQRARPAEPDPARRQRRRSASREYTSGSTAARGRSRRSNDLPVKTVNGATIYISDVAQVRDGYPPQTNIVRARRRARALLTMLKNGGAPRSTSSTASRRRCRESWPGCPTS